MSVCLAVLSSPLAVFFPLLTDKSLHRCLLTCWFCIYIDPGSKSDWFTENHMSKVSLTDKKKIKVGHVSFKQVMNSQLFIAFALNNQICTPCYYCLLWTLYMWWILCGFSHLTAFFWLSEWFLAYKWTLRGNSSF